MTDVLAAERLQFVAEILSKYSKNLKPGHIIRMGMEGDPASTFRSAEDAPSGKVLDVTTHESGEITFRAQLSGEDNRIVTLSNRDVDPARVWEIHPDHIAAFRGDNFRGADEQEEEEPATLPIFSEELEQMRSAGEERQRDHELFRSSTNEHLQRLEAKLEEQEDANRIFRGSMAEAIRAISNDVLKSARGEPFEFVTGYVDRFDAESPARADEFRAADEAPLDEKEGEAPLDEKEEEDKKVPLGSRFAGLDGADFTESPPSDDGS